MLDGIFDFCFKLIENIQNDFFLNRQIRAITETESNTITFVL